MPHLHEHAQAATCATIMDTASALTASTAMNRNIQGSNVCGSNCEALIVAAYNMALTRRNLSRHGPPRCPAPSFSC